MLSKWGYEEKNYDQLSLNYLVEIKYLVVMEAIILCIFRVLNFTL